MSLLLLIFKSAFRNRLRTLLTSVGVGIAIVAFLAMRTFISAWYAGVENSSSDRLIARNKISITFPLPLSHVQKIRDLVGDHGAVSYQNWFGGVYPKDEHGFFASLASDEGVFKLYPEVVVAPDQWEAWMNDRQGAMVGVRLAEKYGWKLGDRVTLRGAIYGGNWDYNVRALYRSTSKAVDESSFYFHWKYLNETNKIVKDQVGIIVIKINDASQSAAIANTIDKAFASSLAETRTESEKSFQLEFLSMVIGIIYAIQVISFLVLIILMLVLANTMAMATRERTTEYAVMRAIGFQPRHIVGMVLGEGFVVAFVGALLGLGMAIPVITYLGIGLEKKMGGFLGDFSIELKPAMLAVAVSLLLGMLAAALPAWRAGRLKIVDALRRVE
jgi:putative ABC transport system permease protein